MSAGLPSLKERIAARIAADGPIALADYMQTALLDPLSGYYTTRDPIGGAGDFITAPEISQMFGELVGVWLASAWLAAGQPQPFVLAEPGPGRGTLMADALRAGRSVPGFVEAARVALVEASPRLRELQGQALAASAARIDWYDRLEDVPPGPMALIANEFFDALPIRQFEYRSAEWHERRIGLAAAGALALGLGPGRPDSGWLAGLAQAGEGDILEVSPASIDAMETIARRIANDGFAALVIDYGHDRRGYGDTFQAMRGHAFTDPLESPGAADLTAHVDFPLLTAVAKASGSDVLGPVGQGDFLLALGLLERAGRLGAGADHQTQEAIRNVVERLAGPDQMGTLFKAIAVVAPGLAVPGFERQ